MDLRQIELDRAMSLGMEVEQEFIAKKKGPLANLLAMAKDEAIAALAQMVTADPEDAKAIRNLQNRAQRYRDLLRWTCAMLSEGREAWDQLDMAEQESIIRNLNQETDA